MPKDVLYPFALDENNNLVHIHSVDKNHRHDHNYTCPHCGYPMKAYLGEYNANCFAHDSKQRCSAESYIHHVAKRILADRFNDRSKRFIVRFPSNHVCRNKQTCPYFEETYCMDYRDGEYDLHNVYDLPAQVESDIKDESGHFKPDVILQSSDPKHKPIYLEVWHRHKCSKEKLESGNHIIEIKIRDMNDLEGLSDTNLDNKSGLIEFYNFSDINKPPEFFRQIAKEKEEAFDGEPYYCFLPYCLLSEKGKQVRRHYYHR